MTKTPLHRFYWTLSADGRQGFARRAGTTVDYIRLCLIPKYQAPLKIPRPELMRGLARASYGKISYQVVLDHFYPRNGDRRAKGSARKA